MMSANKIRPLRFSSACYIALGLHFILFLLLVITVQFNSERPALLVGPQVIQATALLKTSTQLKMTIEKKLAPAKRPLSPAKQAVEIKPRLPSLKQAVETKNDQVNVAIPKHKQPETKQTNEQKRQLELKKQQAEKLHQQQEQALQEALTAEQKISTNRAQAMLGIVDKYKALMRQAIAQNWLIPAASDPKLSTELLIRLAPDGTVLEVRLIKSSSNAALDQSALTAVRKSSPLPVPSDLQLFRQFREIKLTVRPETIT